MAETSKPFAGPTGAGSARSQPSMSFATVAALAPPRVPGAQTGTDADKAPTGLSIPGPLLGKDGPSAAEHSPDELGKVLQQSFSKLEVKDYQVAVPDIADHDVHPPMPLRPRLDDEKTHLSYYSATAPSLDGKSVASGTTFGLDEKESLRPDDSASVKATEDDDSNSGPASGAPNSRVGSEAGIKAFREQFPEASERNPPGLPKHFSWARKSGSGAVEELRRSALSSPGVGNPIAAETSTAELPQPSTSFEYKYQLQPDEKLLEAMESPKDRLFLLQLEESVITFIRDSNEQQLDLPPCNSFYRLLAHRLGDYYALSHFVDNSVSHVKLFRTPFCQLRTPLGEIAQKLSGPAESRPVLPSMKIMRRSGTVGDDQTGSGANTTDPSVGPSNTGSEAGDDSTKLSGVASPADSTDPKDKPALSSRELREAKYREARERIFRDYKESDKTEQAGDDASSEMQGHGATNKKKKRSKHIDDGFDSRSSYNLYYPAGYRAGQMYEQGTMPMPTYNGYMPPPGPQMYQGMYNQPYQQYPPMPMPQQMATYPLPSSPSGHVMSNAGLYPPQMQTQQAPSFGPPLASPYYNPFQQPPQIAGVPPSYPSPAPGAHSAQSSRPQSQMSDQSWGHGTLPSNYSPYQGGQGYYQPSQQPMPSSNMGSTTAPYPYGQLPYQQPGNGAHPIHPVPGSYNGQNFNPQSRVFIPGQMDGVDGRSDQYGSNMQNAFAGQHHGGPGSQGSQASPMKSPVHTSHGSSPRKPIAQSSKSQSSSAQSSLSKWSTPANLPPKPPPPATANSSSERTA